MIFDVKIEFPVSKYLYWEAEWAENYKKCKKIQKKIFQFDFEKFSKKVPKKGRKWRTKWIFEKNKIFMQF